MVLKYKVILMLFTIAILSSSSFTLTKEECIQIARTQLSSMLDASLTDGWTQQSLINEAFPISLDGVEGASYYECKVSTNGVPAGYVLVNTNKTDLLVPEKVTSGKTLYEQYADILGNSNFIVYRYDYIRSVAKDASNNIIASIGFDLNSTTSTNDGSSLAKKMVNSIPSSSSPMLVEYNHMVKSTGCVLTQKRKLLDLYYSRFTTGLSKTLVQNVEVARMQLADVGFGCGSLTPAWTQIQKDDGYYIGCGATAWSIYYAYMKEAHGKSFLFDGVNLKVKCNPSFSYEATVMDCMKYLSTSMGTENVMGDNGLTWPDRMDDGIKYASSKGYNAYSFTMTPLYRSAYVGTIINALSANIPVILLINSSWAPIPNHYVVVEKIRLTKNPDWAEHLFGEDIQYDVYCNMGWGNKWKWITIYASNLFTQEDGWAITVGNVAETQSLISLVTPYSDGLVHTFTATEGIQLSSQISNKTVVTASSKEITLLPGFEVSKGSGFSAFVQKMSSVSPAANAPIQNIATDYYTIQKPCPSGTRWITTSTIPNTNGYCETICRGWFTCLISIFLPKEHETVDSVLSENESSDVLLIGSLYPTPATTNYYLSYVLPTIDSKIAESKTSICLYSISGALIRKINLGMQVSGKHQVNLSTLLKRNCQMLCMKRIRFLS